MNAQIKKFLGEDEEKREVQIANEMMAAIDLLPPMVRNDVSMRKLRGLAEELLSMHDGMTGAESAQDDVFGHMTDQIMKPQSATAPGKYPFDLDWARRAAGLDTPGT